MHVAPKAVWSIPYVSVAFFQSLKQNFIAYCSSKVSDCIFKIHQLWRSGICSVYFNCCCRCSFEPEIIKIDQSSHEMYSNNILNFKCTYEKCLETYCMELVYIYIYIINEKFAGIIFKRAETHFQEKVVVAKVQDWDILINEFEPQLCYCVHFRLDLTRSVFRNINHCRFLNAKSIFRHINSSIWNNSLLYNKQFDFKKFSVGKVQSLVPFDPYIVSFQVLPLRARINQEWWQ